VLFKCDINNIFEHILKTITSTINTTTTTTTTTEDTHGMFSWTSNRCTTLARN